MNQRLTLFALSSLWLLASCSASPPNAGSAPPQVAPPTPSAEASAAATPAAPAAPAPSPEEQKKAQEAAQLAQDFAKAEEKAKAEAARFTPELRAECKALAEHKYASLKAALATILKSPHRKPGNAERDKARHPVETLEFFGITPKQTVLEYGPGEGWFTEILAPVLAAQGKLLVTTTDPNSPPDSYNALSARRVKWMLEKSPELFGKVQPVVFDPQKPELGLDGTVDTIVVAREIHGMVRAGRLEAWLEQFHKALKPSGVLGIEQHRAKPDAKAEDSTKQGYVPEAWLIKQVEAAGFHLSGKSQINANPKDTKDYPEGVWTLPPGLTLGDKDRDKYIAIGESDRMTLRFRKVEKGATKPAKAEPEAKAEKAPKASKEAKASPEPAAKEPKANVEPKAKEPKAKEPKAKEPKAEAAGTPKAAEKK